MGNRLQAIPLAELTEREREILGLLADGMTDSEIAESLVLTVGTVKWYNRQIYNKLGVRSRTQAVAILQRRAPEVPRPPVAAPFLTNLPAQLTSFIGRESEVLAVAAALEQSRLVTLTGAPGTGKTRLALEVAASQLRRFLDGVFVVWLAPLLDASLAANSIAGALNLKIQGTDRVETTLARALRDKHLLLVLDNFEHVLAAAPIVSELLAAAPAVRVLATSRESLRLYGETEYTVPPLHVPDLSVPVSQASAHTEAVELFAQRARSVSPNFALTNDNLNAVATICVHLDGLPLAIELAAARIKFIAPQTLLLRLGSRLEALSSAPRGMPNHQRTLRATLAWSYDLLEAPEQELFARLGVFSGTFNQVDAESLCADLPIDIDAGLESLFGKSLLRQIHDESGQSRYNMLETMREFALETLVRRGEIERVREHHAMYFLQMAEDGARSYFGPEEPAWLSRAEAQHDNMRAALRWTLGQDDERQLSLRLIAALAHFWEMRSHFGQAAAWLTEARELLHNRKPTVHLANALYGVARVTYLQGAYRATRALLEEARPIYVALGNRLAQAQVLLTLGEVYSEFGEYEAMLDLFAQSDTLMRELGNRDGQARAATQLGFGWMRAGDLSSAEPYLRAGLELYRSLEDRIGTALVLSGLGELAVRRNRLDEAVTLLQESLEARRTIGVTWGVAAVLGSLAWVSILRGDNEQAIKTLRESLNLRAKIGDPGGMAWCLEKLALIAHQRADSAKAACMIGAAEALRASIDSVVDAPDQAAYRGLCDMVRNSLGRDAYAAHYAEGQRLAQNGTIADAV